MFEFSLVELAVCALVALLVLGPERLPRAARTAGMYLRRARQSWYSVRADIERELAAEDLKRSLARERDAAQASVRALKAALETFRDVRDGEAGTPRRDDRPATAPRLDDGDPLPGDAAQRDGQDP